jgi:hypothetical protein
LQAQLKLQTQFKLQLNKQSMIAGLLALFFSIFAFYGQHPLQNAFWWNQLTISATSESDESEDNSEVSEKLLKATPIAERRLIAYYQLQIADRATDALQTILLTYQFVFSAATRAGPSLRAPPII